MKRYLIVWLSLVGIILLVVATFNLVVDPYGLFRLVDRPGFNSIKPKAGAHGAMVKAYQVLRVQPNGLILGNSRAEVGLDPGHQAWPDDTRPVFNLALPGTGTRTTLHYLEHVIANWKMGKSSKPEVVVWGVDFMDFLVDNRVPRRPPAASKEDKRLLANQDGSYNSARPLQVGRDYAEATLTLSAFLDSIQTLVSQRDQYAEDLTSFGFNPMHDYQKIAADEGYWALFRQRDLENIKAYLRRPKDILGADGHTSPPLDDMRQIQNLCRQHGIALHLITYPYHAHLLEIIRITGHWPAFETWKRTMVNIASAEAGVHGGPPVHLWDFSEFNDLTREAIPETGNRRATMRWYWEGGHFKRELGDLILNRIFERHAAAVEFGILLNSVNVDGQIAAVRGQEIAYRESHAKDVQELERIASQIISHQKRP